MSSLTSRFIKFLYTAIQPKPLVQQVRWHQFVDWRMLRDYKKRCIMKDYAIERQRINALRKNKVLPPELQALADEEVKALPKSSNYIRAVKRCVLTSRGRGIVSPYRISRIMFRHLADYNKLAGVQRARW